MMDEKKKMLALGLFGIGAIKFGKFKLKLHEENPAAPLSPIYVDLRIMRSFPNVMDSTVNVYKDLSYGLKFDLYADVPTAATPVVAVLSHETRIPMISPRKSEKKHGTRSQIDGVFIEKQIVLLVDDLITRADSKLETISVLEESDLIVRDVLVLVDREQGGTQELAKRGYVLHSAFGLKELLRFYLDNSKISENEYEQTILYLEKTRFD